MEIPYEQLAPETLIKLIESFILREGTDYGHGEHSLDSKVRQVQAQLRRGDVRIFFNPEDESINLTRIK